MWRSSAQGPAGFYTADSLLKADPECRIDIIDRLPTPYGLIRFGVAPDHEKTKNVMRGFARTASDDRVNFYGDVDIGEALSLDELREMYDAVVLAVGAAHDRRLGIPGEDKAGVVGSASFVNWYKRPPRFRGSHARSRHVERGDHRRRQRRHRRGAGAGQDPGGDGGDRPTGLCRRAPSTARPSAMSTWWRGAAPVEAKFTNVELREMGHLEQCVPQVAAADLPAEVTGEMSPRDRRVREKNLETLRAFSEREADEKPKRVHFVFFASPVEILGGEHVEAVRFERTRVENGRAVGTGEHFEIACGLVVAAVG